MRASSKTGACRASNKNAEMSSADHLEHDLQNLAYASAETSFSPFYSNVGLGFDRDGGLKLYLHYNRRSVAVGQPFLRAGAAPLEQAGDPFELGQRYPNGGLQVAFCGYNTFLVRAEGIDALELNMNTEGGQIVKEEAIDDGARLLLHVPTPDKRDPDVIFPVFFAYRVLRGGMAPVEEGCNRRFLADDAGDVGLACTFRILEDAGVQMLHALASVPETIDKAVHATKVWFNTALGAIDLIRGSAEERPVSSRAAYTLVANTCISPGYHGGRAAAFPSRGRYPTVFLWDSCFQNLAMDHMEARLSPDNLLIYTENIRADGKIPAFLTSTWSSPVISLSPLLGWAGLRLVKARDDAELAGKLLGPLRKNTQWWLTQRMTRLGLVRGYRSPTGGTESGWANTPRYDHGSIVATDLNSYLLVQMKACAEMADMIGDHTGAENDRNMARDLAARIKEVLFDSQDRIFYDRLAETGEFLRILTPACFLPMWAGVALPESQVHALLHDLLLNPVHFFGAYPFPSVAYSEALHEPAGYWRGPVWPHIAYLMIELLRDNGFQKESEDASDRILAMMLADGQLSEYFDAHDGRGLGAEEQGWTAAVWLQLLTERNP